MNWLDLARSGLYLIFLLALLLILMAAVFGPLILLMMTSLLYRLA